MSRIRWLFVIARNSSFTYKDQAVDVRQVGRELGVRYVLEGSLRRTANRVRITAQLIDATTGGHLSADRFDGTLDDIFELQDQVASSVVGAITRELERAEIERAKRKPTESLDAYDYYLRGMANLHRGTREAIDEALPLFHHAHAARPEFRVGPCDGGVVPLLAQGQRLDDPIVRRRSPRGPIGPSGRGAGQGRCGRAHAKRHALGHLGGDLDGGIALLDRALMLDPNLASAWFLGGFLESVERRARRRHRSTSRGRCVEPPRPGNVSHAGRDRGGTSVRRALRRRVVMGGKGIRDLPSFLMVVAIIAASHALAGRTDEAQRAMRHLRETASHRVGAEHAVKRPVGGDNRSDDAGDHQRIKLAKRVHGQIVLRMSAHSSSVISPPTPISHQVAPIRPSLTARIRSAAPCWDRSSCQ